MFDHSREQDLVGILNHSGLTCAKWLARGLSLSLTLSAFVLIHFFSFFFFFRGYVCRLIILNTLQASVIEQSTACS